MTVLLGSDFEGSVSLQGFTADFGANWLYFYNFLPISYVLQLSVLASRSYRLHFASSLAVHLR